LTKAEIEELRHAENVTKGAIHPDTGKPIPMAMRITFFLPANVVIVSGMLLAKPTIFNTLLWQTINQSYNAIMNFGNANKSSPSTNKDILTSYAMAVSASCWAGYVVRLATRKVT
jgi:hypothetical protein